jgi:hypothetical protein
MGTPIANHTKQVHMGSDVLAIETGKDPAELVNRPGFTPFTAQQKTDSKNFVAGQVASFTFEADATKEYNCHALTFKSNGFWVGYGLLSAADTLGKTAGEIKAATAKKGSDQIQAILDDNGWKPLGTTRVNAMPGDAVITKTPTATSPIPRQ